MFTQEWVDGLKEIPKRFMAATIQIVLPGSDPVYDPDTDSYVVPDPTVLYEGPARITPRRSALPQPLRDNPTVTQTVQFQIPIDTGNDFDLRNNHRVIVTDSPLNRWLENYTYTVWEIVDSSNPIERTFWCIVDQEVVQDG